VDGYAGKLKDYLSERNALEEVTIRKMRRLSFEGFDRLLRGVTAKSRRTRLMTGLSHPDMLYTTLKWFGDKKRSTRLAGLIPFPRFLRNSVTGSVDP